MQNEVKQSLSLPTGEEERNVATINKWLPTWFWNLRRVIPYIEDIFTKYGNRNASLALPRWFLEHGNSCALVLGSGPSLELLTPELLANWNGLVIAGASNATIPAALGRPADIIMAVDGSPETAMQIGWLGTSIKDAPTRLVTCPYIHPHVVRDFPQDRIYFFKSFIPYAQHPLNWYQSLLFNGVIENFMLQAGCTVNSEYSWCALPVDNLGVSHIKKVFLLGVDFMYPKDDSGGYRGRVRSYKHGPGDIKHFDSIWTQDNPARARSRSQPMIVDGKYTDQAMTGYKESFLTVWVISKLQAFNLSPESLITELPVADLEEVVKTQGACAEPLEKSEIVRIYREFNNLPKLTDKQDPEAHNLKIPSGKGRGLIHQLNSPANEPVYRGQSAEELCKGNAPRVGSQGRPVVSADDPKSAMHLVGNQRTSTIENHKKNNGLETSAIGEDET